MSCCKSTNKAAENGHLECLKHLFENGYSWNECVTYLAVENGHLECLKYLFENGCPWNKDATCMAAENGHLGCLKFLFENNVGPFFSMAGEEYIVPPLHGPGDFHEFNLRYDKPIIDLIHDAGSRIHIHSHGSIKKVFQYFIDMGVDELSMPVSGIPKMKAFIRTLK